MVCYVRNIIVQKVKNSQGGNSYFGPLLQTPLIGASGRLWKKFSLGNIYLAFFFKIYN